MSSSNNDRNLFKSLRWIAVAGLAVMMVGLALAFASISGDMKSKAMYEDLNKEYVVVIDSKEEEDASKSNDETEINDVINSEPVEDEPEAEEDVEEAKKENVIETYSYSYVGDWKEQFNVDLASVKNDYPDAVGWIIFENDNVSYPIMYSGDDEKYLKTMSNGVKSASGAIFLEALNNTSFSDMHTLIYGHNMRNGSMFGKLNKYFNQPNYYEYHKYFQIITYDEYGKMVKYRYCVFAANRVDMNSDAYVICGDDVQTYANLIAFLRQNSTVGAGVQVSLDSHIVSLSTCNRNTERTLISAVRVDECYVD